MTRVDIKLRKGANTIEVFHEESWHPTTLSSDMKLANRSIPDVKSLLDSYLDADFLTNSEWSLRLSEQRKIGAALRKSVFGEREVDVGTHLRFVPVLDPNDRDGNDELVDFLAKVPWAMLTCGNDPESQFLAFGYAKPVAITIDAAPRIDARPPWQAVRLAAAPRLLLVMPEVKHKRMRDNTGAVEHREALLRILKPHYESCGFLENIKCVRTFAEYSAALHGDKFYPEIVYFYGHGASAGQGTNFQFEKDGKEDWQPVEEIDFRLRQAVGFSHSAPMIWFNACQGAAANQDSALRIFAKTASCVVAMRTVVRMDASRFLAEKALKAIIIDGFSPPVAIRETLSDCPTDWLRSGHWASITVAEQYIDWTAIGNSKDTAGANDAVGDFPSRVDRTEALRHITTILATNFTEAAGSEDPSVLLWAGSDDERPVLFAERTRDVITEKFQGFRPIYIDVNLQQGVTPGPVDELRAQLRTAIMIGMDGSKTNRVTTADIMSAIARVSPGPRSVLTFFHGPLTAKHAGLVHIYIELWKTICRELSVSRSAPSIVLAFGFVSEVSEPLILPKGRDAIRLGAVPPTEIRMHLSRYRLLYDVDITMLDDKTTEILRDTDGIFRKLVDALRILAGFKNVRKEGEVNGGL